MQNKEGKHKAIRNLKKTGEIAGLPIALTTYVSRHNQACIRNETGFALSAIDTIAATKANRNIIGRISETKKKTESRK